MAAGDYTFTVNGFTFGAGGNVRLLDMTGWEDLPSVRNVDPDRPAQHGSFATPDYTAGRTIVATLLVLANGSGFAANRAALRAATNPTGAPVQLFGQLPGGVAEYVWAQPRKRDLPTSTNYQYGYAKAQVAWYCPDPLIYSTAWNVQTTSLPVGTSGATPPLTPPVSLGSLTGGSIVATNAGDIASPWVATIYGPLTNPQLQNVTTGQTLAFVGTVLAGDYLTIDSQARTVLYNGTVNRSSWLVQPSSSWFSLPPGSTTIQFRGTTGSGLLTFTNPYSTRL